MTTINRRTLSWAAALALAATLSACSSSASGTGAAPQQGGGSAPSASSGSSGSSGSDASGTQANTSGCPGASAVSAAAGTTVSEPHVTKQAGTTLCSYPEASGGGVIAIGDESDAEYSADDVKGALTSQVQALGGDAGSVASVPGIGDAAYEFTRDGATTLGIVSGSAYWSVVGAPNPAAALAIARLVL